MTVKAEPASPTSDLSDEDEEEEEEEEDEEDFDEDTDDCSSFSRKRSLPQPSTRNQPATKLVTTKLDYQFLMGS